VSAQADTRREAPEEGDFKQLNSHIPKNQDDRSKHRSVCL